MRLHLNQASANFATQAIYIQYSRRNSLSTCVVVARNEEVRTFVAASLKSMGMDALLLSSLGDLTQTLKDNSVNGILLEVTIMVTGSQHDKQAALEVLEFFPNSKFKVADNAVRLLSQSFEGFVADCMKFKARPLRRVARKERVLAVYLSTDPSFDHAEKTVTVNLSPIGCFLYSPKDWKIGDRVWMRFPENEIVMSGIIRTWHPWGNNRLIPGIGIELDSSPQPAAEAFHDSA
jgi:hypothetical protein